MDVRHIASSFISAFQKYIPKIFVHNYNDVHVVYSWELMVQMPFPLGGIYIITSRLYKPNWAGI